MTLDLGTGPGADAIRPLTTAAELVTASGGDVFVRSELRADPAGHLLGPAWAGDGAVVFGRRSGDAARQRLTAVGPVDAAARLLAAAVAELAVPPGAITVPRGAVALLPGTLRPAEVADWDWFWTEQAPPYLPLEAYVEPLPAGPATDEALREVLPCWSDRYSAEPGDPHVRYWCAARDGGTRLVAVGAHVEYVPGVPHLASIATAPDARGRGWGAALTAGLTRRAVTERGRCTLGMYADNDAARRLYRRLGYVDSHKWTSGRLAS